VNKGQLFDPTECVKLLAGVELSVIVDSQSLYGVISQIPDIVKRFVECDFLLLAVVLTPKRLAALTALSCESSSASRARFTSLRLPLRTCSGGAPD
jgi:hypothetical protein